MAGTFDSALATLPVVAHAPFRRHGRIRSVLLATDLSAVSQGAATQAIDLCGALGARLLVVNVIDARARLDVPLRLRARTSRMDQLRAEREHDLIKIVEGARAQGIEASFLVWTGEAGAGIVAAAEAEASDLVVVGTRALDRAGRFLLGSVSDYVVNNSPCPVLIAR